MLVAHVNIYFQRKRDKNSGKKPSDVKGEPDGFRAVGPKMLVRQAVLQRRWLVIVDLTHCGSFDARQ